jgi:hypothetical protein
MKNKFDRFPMQYADIYTLTDKRFCFPLQNKIRVKTFPIAPTNNDVENLNMKEENHLHLQIWILQSAIAYAYLPLLILLVLNILLIFGLCFQHSSSSTSAQDNVSTEYTNTVVAISVTHFTLLLPSTIVNIVFVSGAEVTLSHQTGLTFDYMPSFAVVFPPSCGINDLFDNLFISTVCFFLSRSCLHTLRISWRNERENITQIKKVLIKLIRCMEEDTLI